MSARPRTSRARIGDLPSWLELVAEVEPLFGPMPEFTLHAERGIGRGTALVVRDRGGVVLGAALLNAVPDHHEIRWLAVRASARRHGVGKSLLSAVVRKWPPPGDIEVVTFGADISGGAPARALYESFGFAAEGLVGDGPHGGSRQRYVLHR